MRKGAGTGTRAQGRPAFPLAGAHEVAAAESSEAWLVGLIEFDEFFAHRFR